MAVSTFQVSRPILYVVVIRDDSQHIKQLLQLLISIALWAWLHRHQMLKLVETVGKIVDMVEALRETVLLPFVVVLELATFQLGVG